MTEVVEKTEKQTGGGENPIVTGSQNNLAGLDAAKAAGNTWVFESKELERYVARGEAEVATNIVEPGSDKETGAVLVHQFKWDVPDAFVLREEAFKTRLSRVGRRAEQKIDVSHLATVNSTFYGSIISGGYIMAPEVNGKSEKSEIGREQMIEHSKIYPESASEAIETWLDAPVIEKADKMTADFSFLFKVPDTVRVLWCLGTRDNPVAAGVFTFKAPTAEERAAYDEAVQNIETKRQGDVSSTDIEEKFRKKIQYGASHLIDVEGISVGEEGVKFDSKLKEKFITLFNPIWFGDIVDVMHSTFDFMKGRSKTS